jgi:hypothetical protein
MMDCMVFRLASPVSSMVRTSLTRGMALSSG